MPPREDSFDSARNARARSLDFRSAEKQTVLMTPFRAALAFLFVLALGTSPATASDDPNQAIRVALQAELEDFSVGGWERNAPPALGPALEGYRNQVVKVAGDPTWNPGLRAGTIPLVRKGQPTEKLGVTVYPAEGPTKGVLMFVHGYMSHAANFAYTFRFFTQRGWKVYTLDLPGHGLSTGPRADIDSFSGYGDAVVTWKNWVEDSEPTGPRLLMAHSLGTAACLEALRRPTTTVPDRVVFLAPLLRVDWHPVLEFGEKTLGWWLKKMPSTFGWDGYLDGYTMPVHWLRALDDWLAKVARQKALKLPLIIYSGDKDTVVDEAQNRTEYRRLVPQARYVVLPGKGHLFMTAKRDRQAFHDLLAEDLHLGPAILPPPPE